MFNNQLDNNENLIQLVELGLTNDVKKLINAGCDVNYTNENGECPVIIAARRNDFSTFRVLVESGAKLERIYDDSGKTSLEWAQFNQNQEMITFIKDHQNSPHKNRNN